MTTSDQLVKESISISQANSTKLDRLIQLIEEPGTGIISRLSLVEIQQNGDESGFGLKTKVDIMWRIHVWLLCSGSALLGWLLKSFFTK